MTWCTIIISTIHSLTAIGFGAFWTGHTGSVRDIQCVLITTPRSEPAFWLSILLCIRTGSLLAAVFPCASTLSCITIYTIFVISYLHCIWTRLGKPIVVPFMRFAIIIATRDFCTASFLVTTTRITFWFIKMRMFYIPPTATQETSCVSYSSSVVILALRSLTTRINQSLTISIGINDINFIILSQALGF